LDLSSYEKPHQYPAGANTSVIVNGVVVIDQSHHCGATPGVVLKRRRGELGLVA
jgi:hypothetical protein